MLYSIGYGKLTVNQLIEILKKHKIERLIDLRSKPRSRKKGFSKNGLCREICSHGIEYNWLGETLGGFSKITDDALVGLVNMSKHHVVCIMCMEHDPKTCHRYTEIGLRLELKPFTTAITHLIPSIDSNGIYTKCDQLITGNQGEFF